ncbi:hypothetical protein IWW55_006404 [Coemansia sp. RSA 2706]|nr:hypothetical protein LPJ70_007828 [Coemansia sp. RSA 2708]KAJ1831095.1 hypothetical protein LPJ63_004522 [Coemansia sp. RSA 2711]KAJ2288913.1 hypothetical protein IWW55_006404 [Coemansia sp. RSA 2706]KAJ2316806.1 hypothetical protein IWW51_005532 [Coemansia sp. RSA 2702]KAJ2364406.1 hypothetical protein H4S01_003796 [Coemansia sp. RSA 2610]
MVTVIISNLTTNKITLKDVDDDINRTALDEMIKKRVAGIDPSKVRIGTRSIGVFTDKMELADFGSQNTIFLEKL